MGEVTAVRGCPNHHIDAEDKLPSLPTPCRGRRSGRCCRWILKELLGSKNIQSWPWKGKSLEFPSWLSGNKADWYPGGHGFNPWPCSVGYGSGIAMNCGIGCRLGLDPALLWLWLAAAAPVWPLAWELPCAVGVALKKKKKREREKERKTNKKTRQVLSTQGKDFYNSVDEPLAPSTKPAKLPR